jgi:hypothetical protein
VWPSEYLLPGRVISVVLIAHPPVCCHGGIAVRSASGAGDGMSLG